MDENEMKSVEISPSSSEKAGSAIQISSSEDDGTPVRPILCLKRDVDLKLFDQIEDCFILDFDPFESLDITKLSVSNSLTRDDISIVAEKGKVACRDYPHSRHLCLKFPFEETAHESYCEQCYCYVCDTAAPCEFWTEPEKEAHCHASEHLAGWKSKRVLKKQ